VLVVRLGDLEISNENDGSRPQMIPVAERIPHPEYRLPGRYNDIALLRLSRDVIFDGFTRPACLHRVKALPGPSEQIKFIATGWGRVGYSENIFIHFSCSILLKICCSRGHQRQIAESVTESHRAPCV